MNRCENAVFLADDCGASWCLFHQGHLSKPIPLLHLCNLEEGKVLAFNWFIIPHRLPPRSLETDLLHLGLQISEEAFLVNVDFGVGYYEIQAFELRHG